LDELIVADLSSVFQHWIPNVGIVKICNVPGGISWVVIIKTRVCKRIGKILIGRGQLDPTIGEIWLFVDDTLDQACASIVLLCPSIMLEKVIFNQDTRAAHLLSVCFRFCHPQVEANLECVSCEVSHVSDKLVFLNDEACLGLFI
jgi:hypothetical protein